ncbi:O-antigen ligase family protein [Demequina zhanjiangensis]|uniref:O-antigen ligase family protein n=1 Tax=Demequina zhanjiangensis TaxID=3051659 RepID=A0ABT8FYF2_9MICO|nr:O-antigen ligase family protein [Demequina sp. SYSU T00b26]MDN4471905.1 O-antigen ligase family protein [Demequina sp. SYSU T00b26]
MNWRDRLSSRPVRDGLTVWIIVLLTSGQGFRYLLGIPVYAAVCVLSIVAIAAAFRPTLATVRLPLPLGAFVSLATLTVLWSSTRAVSVLAVVVLLATTFAAAVTVRSAGNRRFMVLLYRGFQVSLGLGILLELVAAFLVRGPIYPPMTDLTSLTDGKNVVGDDLTWTDGLLLDGGPIQGWVGNRNPFGMIALLAAVTGVVVLLEGLVRRADAALTLLAAGAVHLLTMSATVTVAALYLAGITIAAFWIRRAPPGGKKVISRAVLTLTAVAAVLTIKYRDVIFGVFDRGADLTNRTEIWRQVVAAAEMRPEGWGYVGYWPVWEAPYSGIVERAGVLATHAHNAFLDTWLQMGLVGLALLVAIVVLIFGSSWRLVERADRGDTYIPLAWTLLTVAMLLQSLTESRILVEGGWYLMVVLFLSAPQVFRLTLVDPSLVHRGTPGRAESEAKGQASAD